MEKLIMFLSSGILLSGIVFPFFIEAVKKLLGEKCPIPDQRLALYSSILLGALVILVYHAFDSKMFEGFTSYQFCVGIGVFIFLCVLCSQCGYDKIFKALFERNKEQ